jgi:SNF2 family DNA or RNA helicase
MQAEEQAIYKQLAEKGHEMTEDAMAVVAIIRCKQFCNWPQMVDADCKMSSKMDAFKEVVDEVVVQNGHKALIFSQYREMLNIIVLELDKLGIKYMRIDGGTPPIERAGMQKKFNEDKTIDVMIGTEAMSAGLNFQSADYVINYDDNWSPAIMAQREDRCHRSGQRNVVTVVNFICRDTIEERIRGVIYAKNRITAKVLGDETDDMVLRRLGPKDVCRLL